MVMALTDMHTHTHTHTHTHRHTHTHTQSPGARLSRGRLYFPKCHHPSPQSVEWPGQENELELERLDPQPAQTT